MRQRRRSLKTIALERCEETHSAAFQEGKWISPYDALIRGSDKIGQLSAAAKAGWRIPATMVTQSRSELQRFFEQHRQNRNYRKDCSRERLIFLLARPIDDPMAFEEASYEAAPAIYQERITGTRHNFRLLCFGERSLAASIDSSDLDWRPNLNVPIHDWPVPDVVHSMTRKVLDLLGLEMGIVRHKRNAQWRVCVVGGQSSRPIPFFLSRSPSYGSRSTLQTILLILHVASENWIGPCLARIDFVLRPRDGAAGCRLSKLS